MTIRKRVGIMSLRPRVYMVIVAVLRFALGWALLSQDTAYSAPYGGGIHAHQIWAFILIAVGLIALIAACTGRVNFARWGLLLAIITSGLWLGQMVADGWAFGAIFLLGLVAKDGVMLRNPLRDPFDRIIARRTVAATGK